jgi:hypothetical protein
MRSLRLSTALAGAMFALVLSAGGALAGVPAPPEQQTGSVGPFIIRDSFLSTAARCVYSDNSALKLQQIVVAAPKVRWPDTNSSNDVQKGTVGHRIIVQRSTDGGATWTKYKASALQKATAYENTPATLSKRSVTVSSEGKVMLRVLSKIVWFNKNGTTRGTIQHWYEWSRWTSSQLQGTIEPGTCNNYVLG